MERLTEKWVDGIRVKIGKSQYDIIYNPHNNEAEEKAIIRLAEYEDTGLTPEEIKNLVIINGNLVRANDKLNQRHKHDMETMKELDEALREYQDC